MYGMIDIYLHVVDFIIVKVGNYTIHGSCVVDLPLQMIV